MPEVDYYKTLGVSREASADEIRKAYKRLSKEYHPDRRPNDKQAAETFKQVQEAWSVLGNPEKREQYDRYGHVFQGAAGGGPRGRTQTWTSRPGAGGPGAGGPGAPPFDLDDIFGGQFDFGDLFGDAFRSGAGFGAGGPRQAVRPLRGEDATLDIEVSFQTAVEGGEHTLQLRRESGVERLGVKIPPGVETGSVIRLAGQGHPGRQGGPPGDLLLTIRVAPHPYFRREGNNLLLDVPITPSEAVLGAKVEVPTLAEGRMVVTVPPGTSSGQKLRLRGKGVPNPKTGERGDQYLVMKIVIPRDPDEPTRRLYEELARVAPQSPRSGVW